MIKRYELFNNISDKYKIGDIVEHVDLVLNISIFGKLKSSPKIHKYLTKIEDYGQGRLCESEPYDEQYLSLKDTSKLLGNLIC